MRILPCLKEAKHDSEIEEIMAGLRNVNKYSKRNLEIIQNLVRFQPKQRRFEGDNQEESKNEPEKAQR